jgi:hypothetical protein
VSLSLDHWFAAGDDDPAVTLAEARESLAYWEERERRLPRLSVGQRREAREMARRWRGRVADAERTCYGAGLAGALMLVVAERRLPARAGHTGRQVARRTAQLAIGVTLAFVALAVAAFVALVVVVAG